MRSLPVVVPSLVVASVLTLGAEGAAQLPAPTVAEAQNSAAIQRFGDETPLGFAPTTAVQSAMAHTSPGAGRPVTLMLGGTEVEQVAEHSGSVLVTFANPADSSQRVLGWIPVSALRPVPGGRCQPEQVRFVTVLGNFCAMPCHDSQGCAAEQACVPGGTATLRGGRITDTVSYCVAR